MKLPLRATTAGKAVTRRAFRSIGWDIVPTQTSFHDLQRRLVTSCAVVVDVGANTGQYAEFVRGLGFAGQLISFEPGSQAYGVLTHRAARDPRWETHQLALGAEVGSATLRLSANSVSSSLLEVSPAHISAEPTSGVVAVEHVPITTLDDQLGNERDLWLKIDVQGTELAVLHGAARALDRTLVVQCELSLAPLYRGQSDPVELIRVLADHGFHMRHIDPGFQDPRTGYLLQVDALFVKDGFSP